jgi:hypothetical protein
MSESNQTIYLTKPNDSELDALFKHRGGICLSVYLPVDVDPSSSEQNPIRPRNMLNDLREPMKENGMEEKRIDEFLAPLGQMVEHPEPLL